MLFCENICLRLGGKEILKDISVCVRQGEYNALIGPNGSGKSTLLSVLSGFVRPDAGRVFYADKNVHKCSPRDRAQVFSIVHQREHASMPFSTMEMVLMGLTARRARMRGYTDEELSLAKRWMEKTDTLRFAKQCVQSLSGGEFQRVVLARALLQAPKVLFLDEAMSEMDVRVRMEMQAVIKEEMQRGNLTVLSVHHDLSTAYTASGNIIALSGGKVAAQGPTSAVMTPEFLQEVFGVCSEIYPGKGILIRDSIEIQTKRGMST